MEGGLPVDERLIEPAGREPAPGSLRLIQLFVNSVNIEEGLELFESPTVAGQWLVDKGLAAEPVVVDDHDLSRLLAFREALRRLMIANHDRSTPDPDAVATIEETGLAAGLTVRVGPQGGLTVEATGDGLDGALGALLAVVVEASLTGHWGRLKVCSNDGCRWAYWDGSRNRSSRWCSMSLCGNRAKVTAHRRRQAKR